MCIARRWGFQRSPASAGFWQSGINCVHASDASVKEMPPTTKAKCHVQAENIAARARAVSNRDRAVNDEAREPVAAR